LVLIFLPEQISWAFNYNPLTLWGEKDRQVVSVGPEATREEIVSARIAASVNHLLNQVAYKENTRVQLQLTNNAISNPELNQSSLFIDSDTVFTKNRIRRITEWLQAPEIHPLNCGIYALRDILASRDVETSLEELSVSSLMVDLMNDIIKPGEAKLKTSLFAINKIADAYGLGFKPAKLAPADVLKLQTPFIASFESEHFVTVNSVDDARVYYSDIGHAQVSSIPEFTAQLTGFVLAPELEKQKSVAFEYVPDSMTPFIWGNKWVDKSDDLPGLMSDGDIIAGAAIQAVSAYFGGGPCFAFSMGVSSFAGSMAQVAVMKWGFSEKQGMMLATAISVGASWGAGGAPEGLTSALGDSVTAGIATVIIGMAVGAVQGYLQYEIAEWLDGQLDEDMNSAIRQGIIGIASSLGASLATTMVVGGISSAFSAGAKGKPSTTNAADLKSMSSGNSTGEGVGQGGLSTQQTAGDGVFIGAKEGGDGTGT
ncbi:MAG: hypothetical protein KAR32_06840, partial [Candidatus Omnitrophica bacterium]|nr:hypothetical protein [Candidatus Omnitrophota bacterium]